MKGKKGFQKGIDPWNKGSKGLSIGPKKGSKRVDMIGNKYGLGYKHTEESRKKMSVALKGKYTEEKHPNWKGGDLKHQRPKVLKRDHYTCQRCGINDKEVLVVDHIIARALRPNLVASIDNLVTLCANCHMKKTRIDVKIIRNKSIIKQNG